MRQGRGNQRAIRSPGAACAILLLVALCWLGAGCASPPPASTFPTARALIDRMREQKACSRGIVGEAKIDYFGEQGRLRVSTLYVAARPESVRFDVFTPLGATLSTFTSDGERFALLDRTEKVFFVGPAEECNVARFLRVPVPPSALVEMLVGQAPILVHRPEQATLAWENGGYRIRIDGRHSATQRLDFGIHPDDWDKPWSEQRVRLAEVAVVQEGLLLYEAEFGDHRVVTTAKPRVDPDGLEPPIPPSGPMCRAEVPTRIRFTVPASDQDVQLSSRDLYHNPPYRPGVFTQEKPPGVALRRADCAR